MIVAFADEWEKCLQNRVTADKKPAPHDDNSRSDLNTAVDREHDTHRNPVEPAQALEMDCVDGRAQEDSSTPQHDDDMAARSSSHKRKETSFRRTCDKQSSKQPAIHNRNHTGEQSSSSDAREKALPEQVTKTKSHTRKEKRQCPYCDKAILAPGFLPDHMRRVHGCKTPFLCYECNKSFSTLSERFKHKRSHRREYAMWQRVYY